jgi:hypothetical protein
MYNVQEVNNSSTNQVTRAAGLPGVSSRLLEPFTERRRRSPLCICETFRGCPDALPTLRHISQLGPDSVAVASER